MVQRAVEELRRLPALDRAAVNRIAAAAAAARLSPADDPIAMSTASRNSLRRTLWRNACRASSTVARNCAASRADIHRSRRSAETTRPRT